MPNVLCRWSPILDASQNKMGKEPIWVRLSGLPVHLWTPTFFKLLGDHLGEFIDVNYSFRTTSEMAMVQILVLLDLRVGLGTEIELSSRHGVFTQILDYEGVPFRCHRCHSLKHLVAQCNKPFGGKWKNLGFKEGAHEEGFILKKAKGHINDLGGHNVTIAGHAGSGMIPRVVMINATLEPCSQDIGIGTNVQAPTSVGTNQSPLGMLTFGLFSHSSSSLKDISQHLMTRKDQNLFVEGSVNGIIIRNESCSIRNNPIGFLDPLVTHLSSEDHSSGSSRVLYDLWNRMVLSDTPLSFCASSGLGRGRGDSMSGMG